LGDKNRFMGKVSNKNSVQLRGQLKRGRRGGFIERKAKRSFPRRAGSWKMAWTTMVRNSAERRGEGRTELVGEERHIRKTGAGTGEKSPYLGRNRLSNTFRSAGKRACGCPLTKLSRQYRHSKGV